MLPSFDVVVKAAAVAVKYCGENLGGVMEATSILLSVLYLI